MTIADPTLTPAAALAHIGSSCPYAVRGLAKLADLSVAECMEQIKKLGFIALVELEALGAVQLRSSALSGDASDRFTFTEFFYDLVFYAHSVTA